MIKVGIRAHDVGKMKPHDLSKAVQSYGFEGVQLVFKKAFQDPVDFNNLEEIKEAFNHQVMMLGAYFNPAHPEEIEVRRGVINFKKHLEIAKTLNAPFVGTETGSLMGSPWGYVKENHDQQTLDQVVQIIKGLAEHARKHDAMIAIEGAYAHVAYGPEQIKYILDQVGRDHIKVTIDLFNFLHVGNVEQRDNIFLKAINLLKDDIVIFHLKDFIIVDNQLKQVGLGQGLMNYPWMIKTIKEHFKDVCLIFEGVVGEDIKTSFDFIKDLLERT